MAKLTPIDKHKLILPIVEREVAAITISESSGIPARTLRRWAKRFSDMGLPGLERSKRDDTGSPRILTGELAGLVQGLALQKPPLSISSIHRKIKVLVERSRSKAPSYGTVYGLVKKMNPAMLLLAHEGVKAYQQKYELIYRRECSTPNEIWQCDHTELDIYIVDANGKERKPWITTIIDDYSRAIAGAFISLEAPSSTNTSLALRQAIWRKEDPDWQVCGIPQILYTDHGSDFMSDHIAQVCVALKIRMLNSAVGRPQGRGKIERFFQTLNECVLIDLPGYSIKGKPASRPSLTFGQLEKAVMDFMLKNYHVGPHSTTGLPPVKMWSEGFLPHLPESPEVLDLLLLTIHKPRKVQRDGISFQGMRYIAPTLAGFVGEPVTVRYDPRDLAEIRVYHRDGFLCKAICQDIEEMVVSLKDIRTARGEVKKDLYQQIRKSDLLVKKLSAAKKSAKAAGMTVPNPPATEGQPKPTLKLYDNE